MATLKFGLIGMGPHGMRYARHLMRDVEGAELYAVCRQDPLRGTAFAREHNVHYYREYVDLLGDPQVDAVAVVTPPRLHERICTTALAAGKAVIFWEYAVVFFFLFAASGQWGVHRSIV